jgi:hypothetical protein
MVKANSATRFALRHPALWAIGTALVVGLVGLALFGDWRAGAVGAFLMLGAQALLWRPNGPGRRWAERQPPPAT